MKPRISIIQLRRLAAVLAGMMLCGCATHSYESDGMALLEQGRFEQGLAVFEAANRDSPNDVETRRDLIWAREQAVNQLVSIGDTERAADHFDAAAAAYQRARRIAPDDPRVLGRLDATNRDRRRTSIVSKAEALYDKGDVAAASSLLKPILIENPNYGGALALQRKINDSQANRLTAMPELRPEFRKPVTLDFRDANLKLVFESIAKTSGLNILLDKDIRADLRTSIFVKNASIQDTIDLILMQNQLEKKVLSGDTIFIYPALPAKEKDYQDLKVRSFHLVYADAKQISALLKSMLKTRDIVINDKTNSVIMRDTPEVIQLAEKIVADQDIPEPEVMLQVEVLEVTHSLLSDLGIQYPSQLSLTPSAPGGGNLTLGNLGTAFRRDNLLVTPVPTVTFNAGLTDGNTKVLASPRIRVRDREKAKIHIGDRLPVFTNSVTPLATGAAVTTGTVEYIETGIKLEVQPTIFASGEVSIKLGLEVSVAQPPVTNAQSGTTAYPISTRTVSTVLQLKDGETNVLAGLISDTEAASRIMIPGLGEIPALGRLFGTHHTEGDRTEIILSITPILVGSTNLPNARNMEFWSGTEARPRSEPLLLRGAGSMQISSTSGATLPASATQPKPGATPPNAAVQPMSFAWVGPAQAKVGDRISVTLNTHAEAAVRGVSLQVSYDPSLLKAVDSVEGTFFRQGGGTSTFSRDIDQSSGQIAIKVATTGEKGEQGNGSVATVTFQVMAAGRAQISALDVMPSGQTGDTVNFAPPAIHKVTLNP